MAFPLFCTSSYYTPGKRAWYDVYASCADAVASTCGSATAGYCTLVSDETPGTGHVACTTSAATGSFQWCPGFDYVANTDATYSMPCDLAACPSFAELVGCMVTPVADYPVGGAVPVGHLVYRVGTVCQVAGEPDAFQVATRAIAAPRQRASLDT